MPLKKDKNLKQFYTIGEVAEMFNLSETTLRFWEKEFPQIIPFKSGRNIRRYTEKEIDKIRVINNLVKVRGLKLSAAREVLKKNKEGDMQTIEVVEKLRAVRAELAAIRNQIRDL